MYDVLLYLLGYVGESRITMRVHLPLLNRNFLTSALESTYGRNQRLWDDAVYHLSE